MEEHVWKNGDIPAFSQWVGLGNPNSSVNLKMYRFFFDGGIWAVYKRHCQQYDYIHMDGYRWLYLYILFLFCMGFFFETPIMFWGYETG